MPKYTQPPGQSRALGELAAINRDIAALKKQTTQYVVNPEGVCTAIIGNLAADLSGNSTGLEGWGVAVFAANGWVSLSSQRVSIGQGELEWPGSSPATGVIEVSGLPACSHRSTVVSCNNAFAIVLFVSTTAFEIYARTGDGSSPAKGAKVAYQYISIGE